MKSRTHRLALSAAAAALGVTAFAASPAAADYGRGAVYQVELSSNLNVPGAVPNGIPSGGVWLWFGLYGDHTVDYAGSDCGHGIGASSDKGDTTWYYGDRDGTPNPDGDWVVIPGVILNGFGGFPSTVTVPRAYGHYTGSVGAYMSLPLPPEVASQGFSQLQVAP